MAKKKKKKSTKNSKQSGGNKSSKQVKKKNSAASKAKSAKVSQKTTANSKQNQKAKPSKKQTAKKKASKKAQRKRLTLIVVLLIGTIAALAFMGWVAYEKITQRKDFAKWLKADETLQLIQIHPRVYDQTKNLLQDSNTIDKFLPIASNNLGVALLDEGPVYFFQYNSKKYAEGFVSALNKKGELGGVTIIGSGFVAYDPSGEMKYKLLTKPTNQNSLFLSEGYTKTRNSLAYDNLGSVYINIDKSRSNNFKVPLSPLSYLYSDFGLTLNKDKDGMVIGTFSKKDEKYFDKAADYIAEQKLMGDLHQYVPSGPDLYISGQDIDQQMRSLLLTLRKFDADSTSGVANFLDNQIGEKIDSNISFFNDVLPLGANEMSVAVYGGEEDISTLLVTKLSQIQDQERIETIREGLNNWRVPRGEKLITVTLGDGSIANEYVSDTAPVYLERTNILGIEVDSYAVEGESPFIYLFMEDDILTISSDKRVAKKVIRLLQNDSTDSVANEFEGILRKDLNGYEEIMILGLRDLFTDKFPLYADSIADFDHIFAGRRSYADGVSTEILIR